jgi:putative flippase GtrA
VGIAFCLPGLQRRAFFAAEVIINRAGLPSRMISKENSIGGEFGRYVMVGGIAFAADFAFLAAMTGLLGVHYLAGAFFAFLLGTWVNYLLSVRWVFGYRSIDDRSAEFGLFLLVGVVTLGLSLGLMVVLVEELTMHVLLARCVTAVFTLMFNFVGRRALLFTRWGRALVISDSP